MLDLFRTKFARHFLGDFLGQVINDVVIHHPHLLFIDELACLGIGPHTKADDRRRRGRCQSHIAFRDRANTSVQNAHFNVIIRQIVERRIDRLHTALNIGLHQHWELNNLRGKIVEHRVETGRGKRSALLGRFFLAVFSHFASALLIFNHGEVIASTRYAAKAQHFDRGRWASFLHLLALVIDQSPHTPAFRANHESIAALQCAARHQHSGDRTAALIKLSLNHGCIGIAIRTRFQFKQFSLQIDRIEQRIKPSALGRRDLDILNLARHFLDDHFMLKQTAADIVGIGLWLIHFVDRNNHRHASSLCVADRFDGLRHDAIIGGHHKNNDIGDIGTASAHLAKSSVARRIEECDRIAALSFELIATDMLGNPASLALSDIGTAQSIKQAGFAVIDMAHDRNHRRARFQRLFWIVISGGDNINVAFRDASDIVAKLFDQQFSCISINRLIDGDHHIEIEQRLHQISALFAHPFGQLLNGDRFRHDDIAHLFFTRSGWPTMRAALFLAGTL